MKNVFNAITRLFKKQSSDINKGTTPPIFAKYKITTKLYFLSCFRFTTLLILSLYLTKNINEILQSNKDLMITIAASNITAKNSMSSLDEHAKASRVLFLLENISNAFHRVEFWLHNTPSADSKKIQKQLESAYANLTQHLKNLQHAAPEHARNLPDLIHQYYHKEILPADSANLFQESHHHALEHQHTASLTAFKQINALVEQQQKIVTETQRITRLSAQKIIDEKEAAIVNAKETLAHSQQQLRLSMVIILFSILLIFLVTLFVTHAIKKSFASILRSMQELAKGNTTIQLPKENHTEIGQIAKALMVFKNNIENIKQQTHQREVESKSLYTAAYYDALTKLPNRALFLEKLQKIVEKNKRNQYQPAALFFIDLDRFKAINDSMGHDAGDELLRQAAQRLQKIARSYESVARLGGDEFTVIIENIEDKDLLLRMAERFLETLTTPFKIMKKEVYISGSIGIYLISKEDVRADNILRNADLAMYKAKKNGRSCCEIFHENQLKEALSFIQLENGLRSAINNKEILVYYQPIINLHTRKLAGFESLVRWQHPQYGLIHPAEFVPVAEETGLIKELGFYVLEESCQQIQVFQDLALPGEKLTISVNLSPNQVANQDSVKEILSVVKKAELPENVLKVECTETALIKNNEAMLAFFQELKSLGVQLCIDDFGTGYSALEYIHKYPFDILKIDRSFTSAITKNQNELNLVSGIVSLAHNMGLQVVAEGVEQENEIKHLLQMNVDFLQGFYFSKPLPFAEACTFITEKNSFNWEQNIEYVMRHEKQA